MTIKPPTHHEIAARAYQLYVERGRLDGYDVDDWLQAEYELLQLPIQKLAEMEPPLRATKPLNPKQRSLVEVVRGAMAA
jgi:hypothetical protein